MIASIWSTLGLVAFGTVVGAVIGAVVVYCKIVHTYWDAWK
jgi:ABC-type amino acid transport system permease subunit